MKDQMLIGFFHRQVLFICGLVNVEEGSTTSRWICRSTFLIPPFIKFGLPICNISQARQEAAFLRKSLDHHRKDLQQIFWQLVSSSELYSWPTLALYTHTCALTRVMQFEEHDPSAATLPPICRKVAGDTPNQQRWRLLWSAFGQTIPGPTEGI